MASSSSPSKVQFHYIKSNAFRVVHADGAFGGPTPNGNIHISFFSERVAIPTLIEHEVVQVSPGVGELGQQVSREGKSGFVREVEVGVMLSLDMAKKIHSWLGEKIATMEKNGASSIGDA